VEPLKIGIEGAMGGIGNFENWNLGRHMKTLNLEAWNCRNNMRGMENCNP
jgi:hypothetical protein